MNVNNFSFCTSVGSPPEVIEHLTDSTVIAPESAVLEARIKPGDPRATISWYKGPKEVYDGGRCEMTYSSDMAVLVINDAEMADAGKYKCEAYNKVGRVDTTANLTVYSKYLLSL